MSDEALKQRVAELELENAGLRQANAEGLARCISLLEIIEHKGAAVTDLPALIRTLKADKQRFEKQSGDVHRKALGFARELAVLRRQHQASIEYINAMTTSDNPEALAQGARIILENNPEWRPEEDVQPTAG